MVFHDNLQQVLEKVETGEIITKVLRDREYTQKIRYQLVRYYWQRFSQDLLSPDPGIDGDIEADCLTAHGWSRLPASSGSRRFPGAGYRSRTSPASGQPT